MNFKLIALACILACSMQSLQASIESFWNSTIGKVVVVCAATGITVGAGWKAYTSYNRWYATRLERKALAFVEETENKYKDIVTAYSQTTHESEQYKQELFSALILKVDPSDSHFYKVLDHVQESIKQIENYLYYLVNYKEFETTCSSLTALKKNLTEIKEVMIRVRDFAQTKSTISTIENQFAQEYTLLTQYRSEKDLKRAIRDLIMRSAPKNTDLKFVAYNQKISDHSQLLRNCLTFSIFNSYYKKEYHSYYDAVNALIQSLEHIRGIVQSHHYFKLEEEVQNLRIQIKDLRYRNQELQNRINSKEITIENQDRRIREYQHSIDKLNLQLRDAYNQIHYLKNQNQRPVNNSNNQRPTYNINPPPYNPEYTAANTPPAYNPEFYDENGVAK